MTRRNAEALLKEATGGVEGFNKLIKYSRGYNSLTDEQKEALRFLRKCYREEDNYMDKALSYALANYHINYDYLIANFKI